MIYYSYLCNSYKSPHHNNIDWVGAKLRWNSCYIEVLEIFPVPKKFVNKAVGSSNLVSLFDSAIWWVGQLNADSLYTEAQWMGGMVLAIVLTYMLSNCK